METLLCPPCRFSFRSRRGRRGRQPPAIPIPRSGLRHGWRLLLILAGVLCLAGLASAKTLPRDAPAASVERPLFRRCALGALGRAPDGRAVSEAAYTCAMDIHALYFSLYFFGDTALPEQLAFAGGEEKELENYVNPATGTSLAALAPAVFLVASGGDGSVSASLAPDGSELILNEETQDIYYGEGADIRSRFAWDAKQKTYILASREETSFSARAIDALIDALHSGQRGRVLDALTALGDISGRSGSLYAYPPDFLLPDLWRYFERYARETSVRDVRKAAAELATLMDACVYLGLNDPTSLEGFVVYSLKEADVRPHIEYCAALLETAGEREYAADLRRGLAAAPAQRTGAERPRPEDGSVADSPVRSAGGTRPALWRQRLNALALGLSPLPAPLGAEGLMRTRH